MPDFTLVESMHRRHRVLQTRIAALESDPRARRPRVVQLAEDLVAHATAEQLVLYPFAEDLLGVHGLSLDIEESLDALLAVVGGMESDADFSVAMARLSAAFERHVEGDETGLLPMVEAFGAPEQVERVELTIEEFERAVVAARPDGPGVWLDAAAGVASRTTRGGGAN